MNFVFFAAKVEVFRPVSGVYPDFRKPWTRLAGGSLWTTQAAN
jgi:hypothetical protein